MKKFTKDDLKDGMRVGLREYTNCVWVFNEVFAKNPDSVDLLAIINYRQLTQDLRSQCGNTEYDIIKVTDRDGTVLFEREEEPRELTIEEIAKAFNLPVERVRIKK